MRLRFTKMQGAGNDFVVLDAIGQDLALTPALEKIPPLQWVLKQQILQLNVQVLLKKISTLLFSLH